MLASKLLDAITIMIIIKIIVSVTPNRALSTIAHNIVSSAPTAQNRNNRNNSRSFSFFNSNDKLKNANAPFVTPKAAQHATKTSDKVLTLAIDPRVTPKPTVNKNSVPIFLLLLDLRIGKYFIKAAATVEHRAKFSAKAICGLKAFLKDAINVTSPAKDTSKINIVRFSSVARTTAVSEISKLHPTTPKVSRITDETWLSPSLPSISFSLCKSSSLSASNSWVWFSAV